MNSNQTIETDSSISSRNDLHNDEQNILLRRLEQANERVRELILFHSIDHRVKITQLDNDLKVLVCQKEELEIERDSFKTKYSKLNQELNKMLNANGKQIIDIESVLSENRYVN